MTRNPYAHPMEPADATAPQARVSALAVSSLIFGLLCCLPGAGFIGVILGGAGLIRISQSEGKLGGRTLAFVGVLLGLFSTILYLAVGIGARQIYDAAQTRIFAPTIAAMGALDRDDWASARQLLDKQVSASVSDADLAAFRDGVRSEFGVLVGDAKNIHLDQYFGARPNVPLSTASHSVVPFPKEFKQGTAWIVVVTDSSDTLGEVIFNGATVSGRVTNLGVMNGAKQVWLVDPARPAAESKAAPSATEPPGSANPDAPR